MKRKKTPQYSKSELVEAWLQRADATYVFVQRTAQVRRNPLYDHVCIWSEQTALYLLRAFLVNLGIHFSVKDSLVRLLRKSVRNDSSFIALLNPCTKLTGMERFQYPPDFATKEDATVALDNVKAVRTFIGVKLRLAKLRLAQPRAKKRR